ncbi:tyrosine-type recombinase/integrase [Gulosibacter sp. 10]|uniref:tyrosine-type recombinase/integrase n=1 Tax=Gulosibacter sp. 10 TaxID=1255570 RepID=UPI0020CE0B1C|nr:tyrosine-type recombinase/integrase [Gulosibacter sp. 10]
MMILRQAARDGIIPAAPPISIPKQESVRHDHDHDQKMTLQILNRSKHSARRRRICTRSWSCWPPGVSCAEASECLGLQRRDIQWHDDGTATLHVRRQFNANTGEMSGPKSEAGKRTLSVPRVMVERLKDHLRDNVAPEAKAPVVPSSIRGSVPLSRTKWGHLWGDSRDAVKSTPLGFRFHDLRHTGLTLFAQEGATLAELMRRGGHADMQVVICYQHSTMTRDRELANRMSDRVKAQLDNKTSESAESSPDTDGHL